MQYELSEHQVGILRSLVRGALRKVERGREKQSARWGKTFNPAAMDARSLLLLATYEALGGDPNQIANLKRGSRR